MSRLRKPLRKRSPEKKDYVVDSKQLRELIAQHKAAVGESQANGSNPPKVSEELGELLYKIASRLSLSYQFRNYPFREDMVGDAMVLILSRGLENFDPSRGTSAFSYFTQLAWSAFTDRITREKGDLYKKHKLVIDHLDEQRLSPNSPIIHTSQFEADLRESVTAHEEKVKRKVQGSKEAEENFVRARVRRTRIGATPFTFDDDDKEGE